MQKGKRAISAQKVIKILNECLYKRNVENNVIIHTDNGTEFANKQYFDFVNNHEFLIGSTSITAHPEHNSVMESAIKTIKQGINCKTNKLEVFEFPKTIKTTQHCQILVDKKIKQYNYDYKPLYNGGLTSVEKEDKEKNTQLIKPETLLTKKDAIKPYNQTYEDVKT